MIKPETCDFFGNELDKAKLEIAYYWKDKYEKTQEALDVAVDAIDTIDRFLDGVIGINHSEMRAIVKSKLDEIKQITETK